MAQQKSHSKTDIIKVKRKGIHAKTKTSNSSSSPLYKKKYKGQGR
tara:strand:+ start:227 stop:361 length:135 start_codon:yes stop_codon:yes gene_type:complete